MNTTHYELLKSGVPAWNEWRKANPNECPDLTGADLREGNLREGNLREGNLRLADLTGAKLTGAKVTKEQLATAKF